MAALLRPPGGGVVEERDHGGRQRSGVDRIDRAALASTVYADTVTPLYSLMPAALAGAKPVFQTTYGAPDVATARATLAAAGVTTPVARDAWYTPTHYGPEEAADLGEIRRQLEAAARDDT